MANNYRIDGEITRTLPSGTRVYLPFQYRFGVRHYSPDFGETWTTDMDAAMTVARDRVANRGWSTLSNSYQEGR